MRACGRAHQGAAAAGTLNWLTAFAVVRLFEPMEARLGQAWVFRMYAVACWGFAVYVHARVPETKGRSFEEIARALDPG